MRTIPNLWSEETLAAREAEAQRRFQVGEKPGSSTFIDEETITHGYGELSLYGEFEFPLSIEFCRQQGLITYWPPKP